ncbi:CMRF35-like molecule 7 [Hoplias malabaricus]|uniref:CMRF35-like molecule 7 n=1 Tax=Hoplias malabaricus TaxID=27720 RepID=UPI00346355C8
MWTLILLLSGFFTAGVNAVRTVTGLRGHSVQIQCPYESGYESSTKYLCRGECSRWKIKDIPVDSKSSKDQRFSLKDDTVNRVFNITITDLRTEDAGKYWCAVKGTLSDSYSEIQLQVRPDGSNTTNSNNITTTSPPSSLSDPPKDSVMYIGGGLAFVVMVLLVTALYKQKRNTKRTKAEPIPQSVMQADPGEDDRNYQEVDENEQKTGVEYTVNVIYSTSEPTDDPLYSNAETSSDLLIYITPTLSQQSPEQSLVSTDYSTVNSTKKSPIYSAVSVPK